MDELSGVRAAADRATPPPEAAMSPVGRYAKERTRPTPSRKTPSRSAPPASPAHGACRSYRSGAGARDRPVRDHGIWASSLNPKLQGSDPKPTKSCSSTISKNALRKTNQCVGSFSERANLNDPSRFPTESPTFDVLAHRHAHS
jgi:hypothetical protein